jgi:hypothetical protein
VTSYELVLFPSFISMGGLDGPEDLPRHFSGDPHPQFPSGSTLSNSLLIDEQDTKDSLSKQTTTSCDKEQTRN